MRPEGLLALVLSGALAGRESSNPRAGSPPGVATFRSADAALEHKASETAKFVRTMEDYFQNLIDDPSAAAGRPFFYEALAASEKLVQGGQPVPAEVNRFHNNLDEYLRGLEQLEKGARPDLAGKAPDPNEVRPPFAKRAKDLREGLLLAKSGANDQEGLREIRRVKLKDSSTREEAIEFAGLVLDRVDLVLHSRGMFKLEEKERLEIDGTMSALLIKLRDALRGLAGADPAPNADPLAPVKQAITDAEKATENLKSDAGDARERKRIVKESLGQLRTNLALPKALKK